MAIERGVDDADKILKIEDDYSKEIEINLDPAVWLRKNSR